MKTHKIDPNKIKPGIANFTIEFRFARIPIDAIIDPRDPQCQRWMRLVEISTHRRTVWHEIYAHDLCSSRDLARWVNQKVSASFVWKGRQQEMNRLMFQMCSMASREVVARNQKHET
jgi:hypothetical protein